MAAVAPPQSATMGDIATSHPFTCNSCQVAFRTSDAQRNHMRSDWHRYNLKRRVASLPPLPSEVFSEKVLSAQASNTAAAEKASFEKTCEACHKSFYSENAYQNHLGSQKHKQRENLMKKAENASVLSSTFSLGEPINNSTKPQQAATMEKETSTIVDGMKETTLEEEAPATENETGEAATRKYPLKRCLFCNYDSPNLKLNVLHMNKFHGMFIPEQAYLVDLEGLIDYLHAKIQENNECLFCHKIKTTTTGIQTHMRDKGHCMIAFDTEDEMIEVGEFYDFRSTYSDGEEDDGSETDTPDDGGVRVNREEDGWETDSDASSLDSEELCAVPIDDRTHQYDKLPQHRHHSHDDPRPHRNADGFHSRAHHQPHAAFYSDYELHLPSGRTAGHRSLAKYYRQNLRNYPTAEERAEQRAIEAAPGDVDGDTAMEDADGQNDRRNDRQLISRANGGMGMLGVTTEQRREVQRAEKRERKRENRARNNYQWAVDKKGNQQKHFRDPLLQ